MKTLVIETNSTNDANLIAKFARALKMKVKQLSAKEKEDYHFAQLIDKGMRSKSVSEEEVMNFFRKNGIRV